MKERVGPELSRLRLQTDFIQQDAAMGAAANTIAAATIGVDFGNLAVAGCAVMIPVNQRYPINVTVEDYPFCDK